MLQEPIISDIVRFFNRHFDTPTAMRSDDVCRHPCTAGISRCFQHISIDALVKSQTDGIVAIFIRSVTSGRDDGNGVCLTSGYTPQRSRW